MRLLPTFERILLIFGLAMLGVYLGAWVHKSTLSHATVENFEQKHFGAGERTGRLELLAATPDFNLWSQKRIQGYAESLARYFAPPIGILRIPRVHLEAPLLEGTDDLTLNRGVGRIEGTATVGARGNVGIAGHRDGFFRALKDVGIGDRVELITHERTEIYIIDRTVIVDPHDVTILEPRPHPSLTIVTCYPFYFVGSAPKRYVVQASIQDPTSFQKSGLQQPDLFAGSASR